MPTRIPVTNLGPHDGKQVDVLSTLTPRIGERRRISPGCRCPCVKEGSTTRTTTNRAVK
jgi:hypothetical protein